MKTKSSLAPRLVGVAVISVVMLACQEERIISPEHIPPEKEKIPITLDIAWKVIHTDPNVQFNAIRFDPSGIFGMAYSWDGRGLFTNDGGSTWRPLDLTQWLGLSVSFSEVTIADTRTAWISAYRMQEERLFFGSTEDAGNTWSFKEFPHNKMFQVAATIRPSNSTIYVFESAGLAFEWWPWDRKKAFYVSVDGGTSWSQRSVSDYILDIAAISPRTIMAAVASDSTRNAVSSLLISNDDGASWRTSLTDTLWYFHHVYFTTPSEGIAVAARYRSDMDSTRLRQAVFRTSDGGNSWNKTHEFSIPWRGKYFGSRTGAGIIFAVPPTWILEVSYSFTGSGGFNIDRYRSDDNGQTWAYLEHLRGYYYAPAFAPPEWKIGIRGNQMTQDGGRTWQVKPWLITRAFFTSPYEVFAVKDSLILRGVAP